MEQLKLCGPMQNQAEAKHFLCVNQRQNGVVRMRGLPFDASKRQVVDFFARSEEEGVESCQIPLGEQGVLIVRRPDGRATGDGFVMVESSEDVDEALKRDRRSMGQRYIELFRSNKSEITQTVIRALDPLYNKNQLHKANGSSNVMRNYPMVMPVVPLPRRNLLRIRNLPLDSNVEHVLTLLGSQAEHVAYHGVHMVFNAQGQPSGEAFVEMVSEASAASAASRATKGAVEMTQCSAEDMHNLLMSGSPKLSGENGNVDHLLGYVGSGSSLTNQMTPIMPTSMLPNPMLPNSMLPTSALPTSALQSTLPFLPAVSSPLLPALNPLVEANPYGVLAAQQQRQQQMLLLQQQILSSVAQNSLMHRNFAAGKRTFSQAFADNEILAKKASN